MVDNIEMVDEMPEMHEESVESKIAGCQAMIDQMERMIAENHRMIGLGDDVEGRERMIQHLTAAIADEKLKIEKLKA